MPNIPTVSESGFPDFEGDTQQFILAPAGTPKPIIDLLNSEISKIVNASDMKEKLLSMGYFVLIPNPDQTAQIIKNDVDKWSKVIKSANIKPD
jgi:hypothetical protein